MEALVVRDGHELLSVGAVSNAPDLIFVVVKGVQTLLRGDVPDAHCAV